MALIQKQNDEAEEEIDQEYSEKMIKIEQDAIDKQKEVIEAKQKELAEKQQKEKMLAQ